MASTFNSIAEITKEKETWKLRVRCERVWFKFMKSQPDVRTALEICFLDEEGDKIQAIVPKWRISKLENIIKEGSFYQLENFEILPNNDEYAPTKHPFVLKFHEYTVVKPSEILNIPRYIFNFVNFSELAIDADDYSLRVFDVIAEVYGMDELVKFDRDGCQMMRIKAHLRNLSGESIDCTLWNEFAIQMAEYWNNKKGDPVVIILQHAMVKKWGAYVNLQNSLFASKLIINDDLEDIDSYVKSLKENPIQSSVSNLSRVDSSRRSASEIDEFPAELEFKSLADLDSINEECSCIVYCKILNIQTNQNWYYNACNKCYRKVNEQNDKFWCYHCKICPDGVIARYRVHVRVEDNGCTTSFVLFDHQVSRIIGKKAADLKQALEVAGESESFPDELELLVKKSYLFKLDINAYTLRQRQRVYTVSKLTDDPSVISKWCNICQDDKSTVSSVGDSAKCSDLTPTSKKRLAIDSDDEPFARELRKTIRSLISSISLLAVSDQSPTSNLNDAPPPVPQPLKLFHVQFSSAFWKTFPLGPDSHQLYSVIYCSNAIHVAIFFRFAFLDG
ncbi:Unknown protein [Striga hermonthica]|uniref:Uncharacterized protein n=1 Tax=Striga hermonthica TaxID=68872 RepID=A0A9N7N513_STRHE|nr:Unknown protein [Striga hermonthica]